MQKLRKMLQPEDFLSVLSAFTRKKISFPFVKRKLVSA